MELEDRVKYHITVKRDIGRKMRIEPSPMTLVVYREEDGLVVFRTTVRKDYVNIFREPRVLNGYGVAYERVVACYTDERGREHIIGSET